MENRVELFNTEWGVLLCLSLIMGNKPIRCVNDMGNQAKAFSGSIKSLFQFGFDIAERGPQTGDNGLRQNIRFGQIFQIGQQRVLYPSDVQACFIARQNFIATELFKAFRFFAVIVALNKVNQIRVAQRVCDQREVHVRTHHTSPVFIALLAIILAYW